MDPSLASVGGPWRPLRYASERPLPKRGRSEAAGDDESRPLVFLGAGDRSPLTVGAGRHQALSRPQPSAASARTLRPSRTM